MMMTVGINAYSCRARTSSGSSGGQVVAVAALARRLELNLSMSVSIDRSSVIWSGSDCRNKMLTGREGKKKIQQRELEWGVGDG